jgi:hypothetical protein
MTIRKSIPVHALALFLLTAFILAACAADAGHTTGGAPVALEDAKAPAGQGDAQPQETSGDDSNGKLSTKARQERLAALETEITAAIGEPKAANATACNAIAFGAKPCGGPWKYLIYSAEQTDPKRLERLVKEYNELEAEQNQELGLMSDCMFVMEPKVSLVSGVCTAAEFGVDLGL